MFEPNSEVGRVRRRDVLRSMGLGLAGLTLSAGRVRLTHAAPSPATIADRSVIFLFLQGGPSQIETFDPKMSAPSGIRSATGEVATSVPGVTFGGSFPRLARLADRLAVVRSFQTGDANHDIKPVVSRATSGANLGSIYSRIAGTNAPATGMPRNVAVFPRSVDPSTEPPIEVFGRFGATGPLGASYAPFVPQSDGTDGVGSLRLSIPVDRLDDRRRLLTRLDQVKWHLDSGGGSGFGRYREQAFDVMLGRVADAFDWASEDPRLIARYDTAPLVRPEAIDRKWTNYNHYVDNAKALGKLLLLARRLCEAGCGFVTVTTSFVWDMHADVNNAGIREGMDYLGPPLDYALSAFIEDVAGRGLEDKILLVVTGEMGRTPRINNDGGRDHWGSLAPLLLAGGGLKMGQVVGQSSRDASEPASEPYRIDNLVATVLHRLIDVPQLRLMPDLPREVLMAATAAEPIRELF